MILDNADDYSIYSPPLEVALDETKQSQFLGSCLPSGKSGLGQLLITTRNGKLGKEILNDSLDSPIPVHELSPDDARKLLQAKVPLASWE